MLPSDNKADRGSDHGNCLLTHRISQKSCCFVRLIRGFHAHFRCGQARLPGYIDKKNNTRPAGSLSIEHQLNFRTGFVIAKNAVFDPKIGQLTENIRNSGLIFLLLTRSCVGPTPCSLNRLKKIPGLPILSKTRHISGYRGKLTGRVLN